MHAAAARLVLDRERQRVVVEVVQGDLPAEHLRLDVRRHRHERALARLVAVGLHAHRDGGVRGELVRRERAARAQQARRHRAAAAQLVAQRAREQVEELERRQDAHDAHAALGPAVVVHQAVPRRDAAREAHARERRRLGRVAAPVVAREAARLRPLVAALELRGRRHRPQVDAV